MRLTDTAETLKSAGLSLAAALLLSGCAVAGGMTEQEEAVRDSVAVDQFMPATREMRDNIETQELFAQAAFWGHEYELNPSDLEASIKLAAAVRKLGNPSRAVEISQTSLAIHPRDPYLLAEHAAGMIADERALDAIPVLDNGLRLAPQYGRLWSLKGAALDQMEDYETARRHYARALQITPNDPNVLANIGLSHALAGDAATAEQWLRRASDVPGSSAGVRQNLALVLRLQGKTDEADRQMRIAGLSRGERQLPPEPVPALTPRTNAPAVMAPQGQTQRRGRARQQAGRTQIQPTSRTQSQGLQGQRQTQLRGQMPARPVAPQSRLTTSTSNGQQFSTASEAARAAHRAGQQGIALSPKPFANGPMTTEQRDVLAQIAQSVRPDAADPRTQQAMQQARQQSRQGQSQQPAQPHVVGPAIRPPVPRTSQGGYPAAPGSYQGGYPQQAAAPQGDPRRGRARRR